MRDSQNKTPSAIERAVHSLALELGMALFLDGHETTYAVHINVKATEV